jgi:zinc transport system ATP-binding protein
VSTPALSFRRCSAGYGGPSVVHAVDLDVERGECVALLGPNGSGKTTLMRAALGLARITAGEVAVLGHPVGARRRGERARLGYVPQRHTVATAVPATVGEVVACGRLAGTDPLRALRPSARRATRAAVASALAAVGLADHQRASVEELSGGQQRRVLIARALAAEPEVMVLDEPTAGVDEESQHALVDVLAGLARTGVTMVIVTHELAAVEGLVERSVRLVDGRVRSDVRHAPAGSGGAGGPGHREHPGTDHPADHHPDEREHPAPLLRHPQLGR